MNPAMPAFQIRRIFDRSDLAKRLSEAARGAALKTHEPQRNYAELNCWL